MEIGLVVFKGDTGFSGLSILAGFVVFWIHDVDVVIQDDVMGAEYGVEHVVDLCSKEKPL
jgi:hypothetical protein